MENPIHPIFHLREDSLFYFTIIGGAKRTRAGSSVTGGGGVSCVILSKKHRGDLTDGSEANLHHDINIDFTVNVTRITLRAIKD